jgi:hypothetical protein
MNKTPETKQQTPTAPTRPLFQATVDCRFKATLDLVLEAATPEDAGKLARDIGKKWFRVTPTWPLEPTEPRPKFDAWFKSKCETAETVDVCPVETE